MVARTGDTTGHNSKVLGGNLGGPPVPYHLQCRGGSSGASMYLVGGSMRRKEGRGRKGGDTSRRHFLRE